MDRAEQAGSSTRPVEAVLEGLDPECWRVLHDVDLGRGSRVEHVVFGPPGVFTIGSAPRESGAQARVVAERLSAATGYSVRAFPLVVIDEIGDIATPRSGVYSLRAEDLVAYLGSMAPHTNAEAVCALYRAAQMTSTWSDST
jgi:hypothetical protein